jgi:hypothetical protein
MSSKVKSEKMKELRRRLGKKRKPRRTPPRVKLPKTTRRKMNH